MKKRIISIIIAVIMIAGAAMPAFAMTGRGDKGMMLLRNKYFKACAFNTNIQKFFKRRKIDSVYQLNGFTLAKDISEIKMIVTESSLKF